MPTIKFFIKGNNDPSTIYLRFSHGRKYDFKKTTSLIINPIYWSKTKGSVKQKSENKEKLNLQNKLNDLRSTVLNDFTEVYSNGGIITPIGYKPL
jgi:hypothetical protein